MIFIIVCPPATDYVHAHLQLFTFKYQKFYQYYYVV